jgi:hypothetical protein
MGRRIWREKVKMALQIWVDRQWHCIEAIVLGWGRDPLYSCIEIEMTCILEAVHSYNWKHEYKNNSSDPVDLACNTFEAVRCRVEDRYPGSKNSICATHDLTNSNTYLAVWK